MTYIDAVPRHHENCYGCGHANTAGIGIDFRRCGDGVTGSFVLDHRHQGSPGVAHGGVVAAALDDAAGSVPTVLGLCAVTGQLDIRFRAPVPLGREVRVRATFNRREVRKLHIDAHIEVDGTIAAEAHAVFIEVSPEHFFALGADPDEMPSLPH